MKIIVSGYPKSGNTWVSRLVGQLADVPVGGFLGREEYIEMATEGLDRINSKHVIYKSHHPYNIITSRYTDIKLICVVRDPRDVVVSSLHYFALSKFKFKGLVERNLISSNLVTSRYLERIFDIKVKRAQKMIDVIINGCNRSNESKGCNCCKAIGVSNWCSIPWDHYYSGFIGSHCLMIKYEELLANPLTESQRILEYIGIELDQPSIINAIELQSFDRRKRDFQDSGLTSHARFLRSGVHGEWQQVLTGYQLQQLIESFGHSMRYFGYLGK